AGRLFLPDFRKTASAKAIPTRVIVADWRAGHRGELPQFGNRHHSPAYDANPRSVHRPDRCRRPAAQSKTGLGTPLQNVALSVAGTRRIGRMDLRFPDLRQTGDAFQPDSPCCRLGSFPYLVENP